MAGSLQKGASYKPLQENLDPRTATLREIIEAHAAKSTAAKGPEQFKATFMGKGQFTSIFKDYLDKPAVDFVATFADEESNPLVQAFQKNEKVNPRRDVYSKVGAIEFHIRDQLERAGALNDLFPEGMPLATNRVVRPDKPGAKARRYSFNPGLMGEWLQKLDEYGKNNPKDIGIVKALEAQAHMGLRPGEIMNAPASALSKAEKRSKSWGFFLDTDTPGVKMDENLNIAIGPRTYEIMQQALAVSPANDRNLFVNPDGSPIAKGEMTRVAKQIKVPGIMTDEQTGKKLNTLQEAYDLRRMWVTLALNEFPGEGNRVGAAQGRAVGATTGGGGAVKEYYSPSRGFYGDAATKVPFTMDEWLFEARIDELPESMKPPAGQRISYKTDFTSSSASPIFEPKDAPIKIGDVEATYFEPAQKVDVVQPKSPPVSSSEPTIDKRTASITPDLEEDMRSRGLDWQKILDNFGKKTTQVVLGAVGVETARQIIEEPATFAAETAAEAALTALKVPAGIAGGAVAAMQPSVAGEGSDIYPEMRDSDDTVYERMPSDDMSTRVTEPDTGFLDIDRVPEAAPVDEDQGFLSR